MTGKTLAFRAKIQTNIEKIKLKIISIKFKFYFIKIQLTVVSNILFLDSNAQMLPRTNY